MAIDGEIDYGSVTHAQLIDALGRIDKERFPLNYLHLLAALEQRRAAEAAASSYEPPTPLNRHALSFTGDGHEYFRIWIVNLALTIATLGIYSAWAKVRKQRYFYGNTILDGSAFGYHAEPLRILKGRLIAVALLGLYFAALRSSVRATLVMIALLWLVTPWLLVKSRMFTSRVSSWRGIRFSFEPDYRGAYATLLGNLGLVVISFGALAGRLEYARYKFTVSRTSFGAQKFTCNPRVGQFHRTFWGAMGLIFLIMILVVIVFGISRVFIGTGNDTPPWVAKAFSYAVVFVNYVLIGPVLLGFTHARNLNEVLNHTTVGPHRLAASFRTDTLIGLYLRNVCLIILTAGVYTPWAQVRIARYRCECVSVEAQGPLAQLSAAADQPVPGAAMEELGSFFDLDFGF